MKQDHRAVVIGLVPVLTVLTRPALNRRSEAQLDGPAG
ncbi:hypothetical protein SAMN05216561_11754 [Nocardioides psychrotolerans]|uniref:Uncharacterized protein n=1 Tax=Nocardioides psychrotolerans TaxID=1005945 RepID=A0A1I3N918_9ACTN|nr:hypothetical protein SAMN05216561_11754 [Nocardioides psychrotolerans]